MVPQSLLWLSLLLITGVCSNELTRCCSGGSRHFHQTATCSAIKSEGSGMNCVRAASICCLRALLDAACEEGAGLAKQDETCPVNINVLGGGLRKECCDCCLLAKELVRRNEPCIPPTGFSAACLKAFSKCCSGPFEFTQAHQLITGRPAPDGSVLHLGDRCSTAKCDHLCNDRGGDSVECSCRAGFELGPDGTTCVDKDECASPTPPCDYAREMCRNTIGGYLCLPLSPHSRMDSTKRTVRMRDESRKTRRPVERRLGDGPAKGTRALHGICHPGYALSEGACRDLDECPSFPCVIPLTHCLNMPGGYSCVCQRGFYYSQLAEECLDVDECQLLVDDCLESQRCLNTPGSFKCIRTLSCGTGYAMDSDTELCIDVDECNLGAHDCGALYQCRNTQGSYRCDPKKCADGELQNPQTGECTSIDCPMGFYPKNGMCNDVDECASSDRCGPAEQCVNTPGSFRCQERDNLCAEGYRTNSRTGFCEDVNECDSGACGSLDCINLPGSFKCRCNAGYDFNEISKRCEDVDECAKFAGHVCDLSAECQNTIGSFVCKCNKGFQLASDGRRCEDINECATGLARCEQKCVNIPGSFQCICDRGFALGPDGVTCNDIDECAIWAGSGSDLCMGGCVNTRGSYLCQCPPGYKIQPDGRTCVDVDECALGECHGHDRICVNTLGQFKCHRITCPDNYVHDNNLKNRCNRARTACDRLSESVCREKWPVHHTWQYIAIPRSVPISTHRPSITLFTIKGPSGHDALVQFELQLVKAVAESATVLPAIRANFMLQKGKDRNSAVIALRDSLDGPQTVELQLTLRLTRADVFAGTYVANLVVHISSHKRHSSSIPHIQDGYSCIKACMSPEDSVCLANHTREILYQFRAVPSLKFIAHPIERDHLIQPIAVSRIRTHMEIPFSVEYSLDSVGQRHFAIEQDRNIGIVMLVRPLAGPMTETIRVNIHTKSRTGVVLAYNVAIIEVHVSRYSF